MTAKIPRYLAPLFPSPTFRRQMRFIAGPRQVGKTTMVKAFLEAHHCEKLYYNWDVKETRTRYRKNPQFFFEDIYALEHQHPEDLWVCFDEIHKVKKWKNILKEHFDTHENDLHTIVTGSARLDLFRKAGDSLAGRYFLFHLMPLTIGELLNTASPFLIKDPIAFITSQLSREKKTEAQEVTELLLKFSGFPEPFSQGNEAFHRIWQRNYIERIVYEDLSEMSHIQDLDKMAQLLELMPDCVGSPLSINSIREDLDIHFATAKRYIKYLELAYLLFTVKPYHKRLHNAIKKESKVYFYDWTKVDAPGPRFENYVACQLLAMIHLWNDSGQANMELHFVKTKGQKEVGFLITLDKKPWLLIEVKLNEETSRPIYKNISKHLGQIPIVQIIQKPGIAKRLPENIFVLSSERFF